MASFFVRNNTSGSSFKSISGTYCHTVWYFCKASDTRKLERVQERALRAVYNNKTAAYDELLSKAKLPSLVNRRLQDILILMYKVKNLLAPKVNTSVTFLQAIYELCFA